MTDILQNILQEAAALPKEYQASVLTFVHFVKFQELAQQYDIDPDELLCLCIKEIAKNSDKDFQKALDYVLEKNKELYKKLA